jgi:transcriptional regulator with XRE-family HTH domain
VRKPDDASPNALLRRARESQGWTQEELAEKLGTTSVTISRWESGVTIPGRYFQKKLSNLYGMTIAELGLIPGERRQKGQILSTPFPMGTEQEGSRQHEQALFFFNEPLLFAQECFARKRERETLLNRTHRLASTSIVGPRRVGKTWLVDYLRLTAAHEFGSRFHIGYLDATMPSCQTEVGFATEALEVLGLPTDNVTGLLSLELGLKTLRSSRKSPVLCIDEFEGMRNRQDFTLDFFRGLRAMAHAFGLVLIVLSRQPISAVIGKDMETSGFFNIFEQIILEPFQRSEAETFILAKSRLAGFGTQEVEAFWHYAEQDGRWPPLRLQLVGKLLLEERLPARETAHFWQHFEQRLESIYREVVY